MSDLNNTKSGTKQFDPVYVMGNTANVPLPFSKAISDVPDPLHLEYLDCKIQFMDSNVEERFENGHFIPALHFLNLPERNDFLAASSIYAKMKPEIVNTDTQEYVPYFRKYPRAIIYCSSDSNPAFWVNSEYCREHGLEAASRLAQYYAAFRETKLKQQGAMFNFFNMLNFNGDERTKNIMRNVRWSWLNGFLNQYMKTPSWNGDEAYLIKYTAMAVGKNAAGGDIVSLPWWNDTIWGNIACHVLPLDNATKLQFTSTGVAYDDTVTKVTARVDADESTFGDKSKLKIARLLGNMYITYVTHGVNPELSINRESDTTGMRWDDGDAIDIYPSLPHIENPWTMWFASGSGSGEESIQASSGHMNDATLQQMYAPEWGQQDNLTARAWNAYTHWTNILERVFPEMSDKSSDKYVLAKHFGFITDSTIPDKLRKAISEKKYFKMEDMAQYMSYRDGTGKRASTATIIRSTPPIHESYPAVQKMGYTRQDCIDYNFCRYNLHLDDADAVLSNYQNFPHLNPSTFIVPQEDDVTGVNMASFEPAVVNTIPYFGKLSGGNGGDDRHIATLTGKYGAIYDMTKVNGEYRQGENKVFGIGVTKEILSDSLTLDSNTIAFKELPEQVMTYQMPLIDNSDPFQCGFYLMVSNDDAHENVWSSFFKDKANRANETCSQTRTSKITFGDDVDYPASDAFDWDHSDTTKFQRCDIANPDYLKRMKHTLIFLGGDIFNHPLVRYTHPLCSIPTQVLNNKKIEAKLKSYFNVAVEYTPADYESLIYTPNSATVGKVIADLVSGQLGGWKYVTKHTASEEDPSTKHVKILSSYRGVIQNFADDETGSHGLIWMCDPKYGPVNPICALSPAAYLCDKLPRIATTANNPSTDPAINTVTALDFDSGVTEISSYSGATSAGSVTAAESVNTGRFNKDVGFRAGEWWVFFVDKITSWFERGGVYGSEHLRTQTSPYTISFRSQAKWAATLAAQTIASAISKGVKRNFWELGYQPEDDTEFASVEGLPSNDVVAEPRIPRGRMTNNATTSITGRGFDGVTSQQAAKSSYASEGSSADSHSRRSESSVQGKGGVGRNKKQKDWKKKDKTPNNNAQKFAPKTVAEAIGKVDDDAVSNPKSGQSESVRNSPLDSSSDRADAEMGKKTTMTHLEKGLSQII